MLLESVVDRALETFVCKICLGTVQLPAVLCVHCKQMVGCSSCVDAAVKHSAAGATCMYCRAPWRQGGNDVQEVVWPRGMDSFLQSLRSEEH